MLSSINPDSVKAELKSKGVEFCMASYVDIHGRSKCKVVPIDHLNRMLAGSELFTGAALEGVPQEVNEDEVSERSLFEGSAV